MLYILGMHACCEYNALDRQCRTRGMLFVAPQLSYVSALSTSVHSCATCAAHKQFTAATINICNHCKLRLAQGRSQVTRLSLCTTHQHCSLGAPMLPWLPGATAHYPYADLSMHHILYASMCAR